MTSIPEANLDNIKKMTMTQLRFTTLLLALVLSLMAAVLAHKVVAMINNDQALESVKELGNENRMVAVTKSGRLKGWKMGVDYAPKKEDRNEMINTGKNINSPIKVFETPISQDSNLLSNTETIGTQKLLEATAEIFKMMNKDYHQKARRRPPINNDHPLDDKNKDAAP